MKRSKAGPKRTRSRKPSRAASRKAGRRAAPARKPARQVKRKPAARVATRRPSTAPRLKSAASRQAEPLVPPPDGALQLADPVEAAQEDLRALPERPLFDPDVSGRDDDLAEMLGEEYVRSVTSGEEQGVELRDEPVPEEDGGPFVESSAQKEFGNDEDDSEPEALPTTRRPQTRVLR